MQEDLRSVRCAATAGTAAFAVAAGDGLAVLLPV